MILFVTTGSLSAGVAHLLALVDIAELALFGEIAGLLQPLLLLGGGVLLARNDAVPLVHHQIRLDQITGGLVGSSVPNLLTRTN